MKYLHSAINSSSVLLSSLLLNSDQSKKYKKFTPFDSPPKNKIIWEEERKGKMFYGWSFFVLTFLQILVKKCPLIFYILLVQIRDPKTVSTLPS